MIEETRDVATLDLNSDNDNKIISAKIEITLYPDINYNRLADFILDNCADIEVFDITFDMVDNRDYNRINFNSIKKSDLKPFFEKLHRFIFDGV